MKHLRLASNITLMVSAILLLFTLAACEKEHHDHDHDDSDKTAPELTIRSPNDKQVFNQGDTMYIKGTVSDASLHELSITLRNDKDSSILYSTAPVVHALNNYTINTYWVCNVADHTNATLTITAHDHSENKTVLVRSLHIMP
jgi:hypothetical protein